MHEKILQGVTVGVVAGLAVYWLTNARRKYGCQTAGAQQYAPLLGDVRRINRGTGTCADCHCRAYGLPTPNNTTIPLAADYLCNRHGYAPATSEWNLGFNLNIRCGLDAKVYVDKMQASRAYGVSGPDTVPCNVRILDPISCNPNVGGQVCCTEII